MIQVNLGVVSNFLKPFRVLLKPFFFIAQIRKKEFRTNYIKFFIHDENLPTPPLLHLYFENETKFPLTPVLLDRSYDNPQYDTLFLVQSMN